MFTIKNQLLLNLLSNSVLFLCCYGYALLASAQNPNSLENWPTLQQFQERQQQLNEAQTQNQRYQQSLQIEGLALSTKIKSLENMTPDKMVTTLEIAAQERETIRTQLDNLVLEQRDVQTKLDKWRGYLQEQQNQQEKSTDSSDQAITELTEQLNILTKAIELEKQYLALIRSNTSLLGKRLRLAIEWHARLQQAYQQNLLEKRQQVLQEMRTALEQRRQALMTKQQELPSQLARLETGQVSTERLAEILTTAALERKSAEVELENLRLESKSTEENLVRQSKSIKEQQEKLMLLKKSTPELDNERIQLAIKEILIWELENDIQLQTNAQKLEEQHLEMTKTMRTDLAENRLKLATDWHGKVEMLYQKRQKQDLDSQIQQQQQYYLARSAELREQLEALSETDSPALRYLLEVQITEANEQAQQYEVKLAYLQDQFEQINKLLKQEAEEISPDILRKAQTLKREVTTLAQLLTNKIDILQQKREVIRKQGKNLTDQELEYQQQAEQLLDKVIETVRQRSQQLLALQQPIKTVTFQLENAYKENQRQLLLQRRSWPTSPSEWQILVKDLSKIPTLFVQQMQLTLSSFKQGFQHLSYLVLAIISLAIAMGLGIGWWLYQRLTAFLNSWTEISKRGFLANQLLIGLQLLQKNALGIAITSLFLLLIASNQLDKTSILLSLTLVLIWLGIKLPLNLAWLLLSNNNQLSPERRLKLYRQLQWTLIFTGFLVVLTILGHLLGVSLAVRDLIDTLFMLLLSLTVVPIMYIRNTLLVLLKPLLKSYWLWAYRLVSLLLPLALLAVALLGLIGYINLGWSIAKQMSLFLIVLTGWLIAEGLLADMITFAKNFALKQSDYGLLWTQDIIPLIQKLLGIALIGLAVMSFFWLNGWYADVVKDIAVKESLENLFAYQIGQLSGNPLTIADVLLALLAVWILFWFGSWVRQITYQWIYLNIGDLGIRHSLSVLTQYTVILLGLLITLRVIGFDLTTLMVFAGALGIGIGFGLQNIANNFISGLLLLVERPLRLGDIVTIGDNYEGKVTKIGIRSLTIRHWNYKEIIVPNSELISQTFTNWTHSSSVIRTTLNINVSYNNDPHRVRQILQQVLQEIPEILLEPEPAIFLAEFSDFAINFRIDYYINMDGLGFWKTKSEVLFKIWDHFKQTGITLPCPQYDLHIRSFPPAITD
ncbi:small-conductance mechanosensitive channel [Thioploca ingrica]|uniref:Small-conductance mechanosensitive channel n=1 Tax=Thioploca ingrica TaxID=40754 RepID=A0A090AL05_9GAMM|nr:small-conductance mechanosensitive channel [Thioploca ingrica]